MHLYHVLNDDVLTQLPAGDSLTIDSLLITKESYDLPGLESLLPEKTFTVLDQQFEIGFTFTVNTLLEEVEFQLSVRRNLHSLVISGQVLPDSLWPDDLSWTEEWQLEFPDGVTFWFDFTDALCEATKLSKSALHYLYWTEHFHPDYD